MMANKPTLTPHDVAKNFFTLMALFFACSLALTGCVVGAAAGGAVGGANAADGRSFTQRTTDQSLQQKIGNLIYKDPTLYEQGQIAITVYNSNVLLSGRVNDADLRTQAEKMAGSVEGIKHVYNQIMIGPPISAWMLTHDAWLTTKVKSALLTTSDLNSAAIKVVTDDSTVYLFGRISQQQADLAAQATSHVEGVKQVVTLFRDPSSGKPVVISTQNQA